MTAPATPPLIRRERDGDVLILTIDTPGAPVNTLAPALGDALLSVVGDLDRDPEIRACVIASGKP
ncbi:MAG: hypothetical protein KGO03_12545, partial [Gemmatimonadota bacterium]|nr:hypothetical protein [Gemmatimonadota bacterium]